MCLQNISDKFNPGARQMISAGKAYLKALHGKLSFLYSFTYNRSMLLIATECAPAGPLNVRAGSCGICACGNYSYWEKHPVNWFRVLNLFHRCVDNNKEIPLIFISFSVSNFPFFWFSGAAAASKLYIEAVSKLGKNSQQALWGSSADVGKACQRQIMSWSWKSFPIDPDN